MNWVLHGIQGPRASVFYQCTSCNAWTKADLILDRRMHGQKCSFCDDAYSIIIRVDDVVDMETGEGDDEGEFWCAS